MKYIHDFRIVSNQRQNYEYIVLTLRAEGFELPEMLPGQFAEVRVPNESSVYLRRPLSIHDVDYERQEIKLLIQEVGKGTKGLGSLPEGSLLNLIYPLGKPYTLPESNEVLLIGGGCGVAPLLFLGRYLKNHGIQPRYLIGARNAEGLVRLEAYRELGEVNVTTEDGSVGTKGYVIDHPVMRTETPDFRHIYTCGPDPMMKVIAKYADRHGLSCQVSLENLMACGIGACLCCVTKTKDGNKCVCTEGPVFDSKYLQW